jgi:sugar (pentulose or hexulose) kinase
VGLDLHPDIPTAVAAMTHVRQVFEPDHQTHQLYDAIYRDVYLKMYRRLKPLYRKLQEITGYPL